LSISQQASVCPAKKIFRDGWQAMQALIPSCFGSVTNWWNLQHLSVNARRGSLKGLRQGQTGGVPAFQSAGAGVF